MILFVANLTIRLRVTTRKQYKLKVGKNRSISRKKGICAEHAKRLEIALPNRDENAREHYGHRRRVTSSHSREVYSQWVSHLGSGNYSLERGAKLGERVGMMPLALC